MSLLLMRGQVLTTGTTSSLALMLVADDLQIDFDLNCSGGPSIVTYYIEYSEDLVTWFREVAEENSGKGVVLMPAALRTLADSNSAVIANNASFKASCQFTRQAPFARIQMSAPMGTVAVNSVVAASGNGPYGTNVVVPAAGGGCTPGNVLFDQTFPAVALVSTSGVPTPPTYGVYEIPVGSFPACTNLRLSITSDIAWVNNSAPIDAYLADSGLPLQSRDFYGVPSPSGVTPLVGFGVPLDPTYHSKTFVDFNDDVTQYVDFSGPLGPQSVYFWPPVVFPGFDEGTWNIKNVRILVVAV